LDWTEIFRISTQNGPAPGF